jgi:fumarate reductase (CoM/CoB) subunit A
LRSAYDALKAGADVTMVVKGRAGRSGSSAKTSAGYSSVIAVDDTAEDHLRDILMSGRGVNDSRLARIVAEEAPQRLRELVGMGAPLAMKDGAPVVHPSGDHSVPRTAVAEHFIGLDFTQPLVAEVTRLGCRFLERTAVLDLLMDQGEVVGGSCLKFDRPPAVLDVRASAVILATGGAGKIFKVTSNTNDVTGDGYGLALRAGASLRDMEFIQFYPWRCIIPFDKSRMPIQPSTFVLGAKLFNSSNERFMESYDPVKIEATTRDIAARGIYDQIRARKDVKGGVSLDITALTDEEWTRSNPKPNQYFTERDMDFRRVEMILSPEAHFFMGGVEVDEYGRSAIPGLFAVGESAGGVHGANRLDSQAIPETQVFGARAGRTAAAMRGSARRGPPGVDVRLNPDSDLSKPTVASALDGIRSELQELMWLKVGIVRDGKRLTDALTRTSELAGDLSLVEATSARDLLAASELHNSLLTAESCIRAALFRTESRGAHFRLDFPEMNPDWRRAVAVRLVASEFCLKRGALV